MQRHDVATFKAQGFVVVRGLVPTEQIDAWRDQAWSAMDIEPSDVPRLGYPEGGNRNADLFTPMHRARLHRPYTEKTGVADPFPLAPAIGDQPHVKAVIDQLLGANTWGHGIAAPGEQGYGFERDVVVFSWPLPPEKRSADPYNGVDPRDRGGGHIEGYRGVTKGGPTPQWQMAATLFLDDVGPGQGATFVWPRSHLAVHRYFLEHPEDIPTGGTICTSRPGEDGLVHGIPSPRNGNGGNPGGGNGMSEKYMREFMPGGYDGGEPHEACMRKGDVMFWHHWCVHASTYNGSDRVRQAVIARFHSTLPNHPLLHDDGGVASDGNLWKYWSDAMQSDTDGDDQPTATTAATRGGGGGAMKAMAAAVAASPWLPRGGARWEPTAGPEWQGPVWAKL